MSENNARIIEKDIMAAVEDTSGGDSEIVDLNKASKFSCQAVYDVSSPSAAVIPTAKITLSSDGNHPSQFNKTAHGLTTGLIVQATTAGTLAVPLQVSTNYFVIVIDANYFQLATSYANAIAGTPIAITGVGVTSTTLTPAALSGASVTFQKSNDGSNWINIEAATSITVDGSVILSQPDVSYRYFKAVKALTAGIFNLKCNTLVIGDPI